MKVTYGTIFGILKIFEKVGHSAQCGEPLPGAEKKEATTRQRPAGATSTGDGEPLPGAEKKEAETRPRPAGAQVNWGKNQNSSINVILSTFILGLKIVLYRRKTL